MSVFKPDDSPYYYASYRDEHGDRVRVSTKQITKREAMRVEAELRNRAERVRLGLEIRVVNPNRFTLGTAAQWWLDNIACDQAQAAKVEPVIKRHIIEGALADMRLEAVTSGAVQTFLAAKAKEVSPATANKLRSYVMGIFSRLIERGEFLGDNPVKLTEKLKAPRKMRRTMPPSYVQALMSNPPTLGWLVAFTAAAYAGMRRGEIARAFAGKWPDVDLDARIITLQKTKTGRPRRVAIHPVLLDVLQDAKARKVAMPTDGAYEGSNDRVKEALKRAGIEGARSTFHGLRGTWATQMLNSGASRELTLYMGGWSTAQATTMDLHYVEYSDGDLRGAIDVLAYPLKAEDEGDGR